MYISLGTAASILNNREDLEIYIGVDQSGARFGFAITFGVERRYRPLLTMYPFTGDRTGAITKIAEVLELVCVICTDGECEEEVESFRCLIPQIIKEVETRGAVSTSSLCAQEKKPELV